MFIFHLSLSWVVGALDTAWRAVWQIVLLSYPEKLQDFYDHWGYNPEWQTESKILDDVPTYGSIPDKKANMIIKHMLAVNPGLFGKDG
jgi:hypothetical protein